MSQEFTELTVTEALAAFLKGRAESLNRRSLRNYEDVLELVDEYLINLDISGIDFVTSTDGRARKPGVASVDRVLAVLDDFEDEFLIAEIGAEREFLRIAEFVTRDLIRWLRGRWLRRPRQVGAAGAA